MAKKKRVITLIQIMFVGKTPEDDRRGYKVKSTKNTTEPPIGSKLEVADVDRLIQGGAEVIIKEGGQ